MQHISKEDQLRDEITQLAKQLGWKEPEKAATKYDTVEELKEYRRALRDMVRAAQRKVEHDHNQQWLDRQSGKAIERHKETTANVYRLHRQQRQNLTLPQQLRQLANRLELLSSPSAASVQPHIGSGKPGTKTPPHIAPPDGEYWITLATDAIDSLDRITCAQEGLTADPYILAGEAKDNEILAYWKEADAAYVATVAPWLGKARTIERVREQYRRVMRVAA